MSDCNQVIFDTGKQACFTQALRDFPSKYKDLQDFLDKAPQAEITAYFTQVHNTNPLPESERLQYSETDFENNSE